MEKDALRSRAKMQDKTNDDDVMKKRRKKYDKQTRIDVMRVGGRIEI